MSIQATFPYLHAIAIQPAEVSELEPPLINEPRKRLQMQKKAMEDLDAQRVTLQNEIAALTARIAREDLLYEHSAIPNSISFDYIPPQEFYKLIEKEISIFNFIKDPETLGITKKCAFAAVSTATYTFIIPVINTVCTQIIKNYLSKIPIMGLPLSMSLKSMQFIIDIPRKIVAFLWDNTPGEVVVCDSDGMIYYNDDGTPATTEISNREITCVALAFIAIPVGVLGIMTLQDEIQKLQARHSLNHDWIRTFFSSYFEWKVIKLQSLEDKYSLSSQLQNDPILNQEKYKCAKSGRLLITPMKTPSNQVFQYSVIEKHLLENHTCPVTGQELSGDQLRFDEAAYQQIMSRVHQISLSTPGNI